MVFGCSVSINAAVLGKPFGLRGVALSVRLLYHKVGKRQRQLFFQELLDSKEYVAAVRDTKGAAEIPGSAKKLPKSTEFDREPLSTPAGVHERTSRHLVLSRVETSGCTVGGQCLYKQEEIRRYLSFTSLSRNTVGAPRTIKTFLQAL